MYKCIRTLQHINLEGIFFKPHFASLLRKFNIWGLIDPDFDLFKEKNTSSGEFCQNIMPKFLVFEIRQKTFSCNSEARFCAARPTPERTHAKLPGCVPGSSARLRIYGPGHHSAIGKKVQFLSLRQGCTNAKGEGGVIDQGRKNVGMQPQPRVVIL